MIAAVALDVGVMGSRRADWPDGLLDSTFGRGEPRLNMV